MRNDVKPRLVFDFIRSPRQRLSDIEAGTAPRELFLGYIQLRERGWPIAASDDRWTGPLSKLRERFKSRLEIPSLQMIRDWRAADIIVVTTRLSLNLALIAKLLGKKIVFLDAMCKEVPNHPLRRWIFKSALRLSNACICLSSNQAEHWANQLNIDKKIFTPVFYGVDLNFYKPPAHAHIAEEQKPYLLAVGRDPARDYKTLISAANTLDMDVKLVTKSYLIPEGIRYDPRVQVLDELSYQDLFSLYSRAFAVVIPIKRNTTFMSGIRATMEAMLLNAPVVASRTTGMQEYFEDNQEILYFEPENVDELVLAIKNIAENNNLRNSLVMQARNKMCKDYSVDNYASALENLFLSI